MPKSIDARIAYYLRKSNENFQSRFTSDIQSRKSRQHRLMKYKKAMHKRMSEEGWKNVPL